MPILTSFLLEGTDYKMSSTARKRSETWNYFSISVCDDKKAVCHECQENVARGGDKTNSFNTSNLWKHLKNRHPDKLKELKESEKEASKKKAVAKEQECLERSRLQKYQYRYWNWHK